LEFFFGLIEFFGLKRGAIDSKNYYHE